MKTIKIKLNKITDKDIKLFADYFKHGKVVAYPTDTIYGLGCKATNRKAVERVHGIKRQVRQRRIRLWRKSKKPLLVLISDYKMLLHYCYVSKKQLEFLKSVWPSPHPDLSLTRRGDLIPVTVVLKLKKKMPVGLTGGLNTLAVRLPNSDFLIKIIKMVGAPIVSTSLNMVGKKPLGSVAGLNKYFKKDKPDLVVDAGQIRGMPSSLVDITNVDNIKILRQ